MRAFSLSFLSSLHPNAHQSTTKRGTACLHGRKEKQHPLSMCNIFQKSYAIYSDSHKHMDIGTNWMEDISHSTNIEYSKYHETPPQTNFLIFAIQYHILVFRFSKQKIKRKTGKKLQRFSRFAWVKLCLV